MFCLSSYPFPCFRFEKNNRTDKKRICEKANDKREELTCLNGSRTEGEGERRKEKGEGRQKEKQGESENFTNGPLTGEGSIRV